MPVRSRRYPCASAATIVAEPMRVFAHGFLLPLLARRTPGIALPYGAHLPCVRIDCARQERLPEQGQDVRPVRTHWTPQVQVPHGSEPGVQDRASDRRVGRRGGEREGERERGWGRKSERARDPSPDFSRARRELDQDVLPRV